MKHLVTLFFCCLFAQMAQAQVWLDIGAKALYGFAGSYNQNIINDRFHDYDLNTALSYGGRVGLNFGSSNGINFEALVGNHEQSYTFDNNIVSLTNQTTWKNLEMAILYRHYSQITYVELGPKLNRISSLEQNISTLGVNAQPSKDNYTDQYITGVLGFGGFIAGSEALVLSIGMRLEYALNDFVNTSGKAKGMPTPYTTYNTYTRTAPFALQFCAELSFGVGGVAKASCGRRRFLFARRF